MKTSNWQYFLHRYYTTCEKCCFLPIHWDNAGQSVKLSQSRIRLVLWGIMQSYLILDTGYLAVTMCTVNYRALCADATMKLLSHGLSRMAACLLIAWFANDFKSANNLINQVCKVHQRLKGSYFISFKYVK